MSAQVISIDVDFSTGGSSEDCGSRLLEVPTDTVEAGDTLEFRLWGSLEDIDGFELRAGIDSLGVGSVHEVEIAGSDTTTALTQMFFKQIDFEQTYQAQLDFPIESLYFIEALTELLSLDSDGLPYRRIARGVVCTQFFERKGGSCIRARDRIPLFGSVGVTALRPRYYRRWQWVVPAKTYGDQWFFLYYQGDIFKKFAVNLPDLATSAGTANITIRPVDESSEAAIVGASVYLDGALVGTTGENGLKLDGVRTGTHTIRIVASGYLDTNADEISNDTIVIS